MGASVPAYQIARMHAYGAPTARYVVTMNRLFWKSAIAFLALPGVVAFAVPFLLAAPVRSRSTVAWAGLVPLLAGSALLAWCVRGVLRGGTWYARAVGAAAGTRRVRTVSLLAKPDVCGGAADPGRLGGAISVLGLLPSTHWS